MHTFEYIIQQRDALEALLNNGAYLLREFYSRWYGLGEIGGKERKKSIYTECSHVDVSYHNITVPTKLLDITTFDFGLRVNVFERLRKVILENNLNKYADFILHGSYATGTVTPFSDIDILVIVKKEVLDNSSYMKHFVRLLRPLHQTIYCLVECFLNTIAM